MYRVSWVRFASNGACVRGAIEKQNTLRVCLFVVLLYISRACTFFELIKCNSRVAFVLKQSKRPYNAGVMPEMIAVQLIQRHTKTIMTKIGANLCALRFHCVRFLIVHFQFV